MYSHNNYYLQVIGVNPYENKLFMDTKRLCDYLLNSMQPADDVDNELYFKNLALLVCIHQGGTATATRQFL